MRRLAYRLSFVIVFMIPWEGGARLPNSRTAVTFVTLGAVALWASSSLVVGRVRRPGAFLVATGLFVTWSALSIVWSSDPWASTGLARTWAVLFLLVFMFWDLYRTREAILSALQAYVLGAYVAVGAATGNYLASNPFYTHHERFSPGDTNPDGFGFLVALGVPVAWYLGVQRTGAPSGRLLRWLNYAYIPVAFFGIALSGTRTAGVAALVGTLFGLVSLVRTRAATLAAALVILAVGFPLVLRVVEPLKSFERLGTTSDEFTQGDLNGRREQWRQGFLAFAESPIVGVGANNYRLVNSLGKEAHNSFLSMMVEVGLIGLAFFAAVLVILLVGSLRLLLWDRAFWLTIALVWAIGASTLTWEHRKSTWLFFALMAAAEAIHPLVRPVPGRRPRWQPSLRPAGETA